MLYALWDLGFKVGHASRTIEECVRLSKEDFTIRTSILEARRLTGDERLAAAFARVEVARGDTSLTYFEFGTLAAFHLFSRARPDALVLEVGLGGRLDAVNVLDADCAVLTSVGIDHAEFLGPDRESIGREKEIGRAHV